MYFSYFSSDITKCKPLGVCSIGDMIKAIKSPNKRILGIIEKIQEASETGDEETKQHLKTKLYFFTPAVIVRDWRNYDNIDSFSGLMTFDFDKLDKNHALELKHFIFDNYDFVVAAWLSVSKKGVRVLVKIPEVETIDQYKSFFLAIENYEKFGQFQGFDPIVKNPVQPLFISHDPDLLYRDDYTNYMRMYIEPEKINPPEQFKSYPYSQDDKEKLLNIVSQKINNISDNGHHPLRAAAFYMGGYVASGVITENDAIDFLNKKIDNHHYLKQKADTYKKTVVYMVRKGQSKPLTF